MCSSLCACANEQSEDGGAFWLALLTPGAILATTMVVEEVDGNAKFGFRCHARDLYASRHA